jgi:hypothetical protein
MLLEEIVVIYSENHTKHMTNAGFVVRPQRCGAPRNNSRAAERISMTFDVKELY